MRASRSMGLCFAALLAACGSEGTISSVTGDTTTAGAGGDTATEPAGTGGHPTITSSVGGATTASGGSGGTGGAVPLWCLPRPACDAPPPDPGAAQPWTHDIQSPIIVASGSPNHRGRDLFLNPGDPQWILAKFAYGLIDKDLKDESVDVYLLRDCGTEWEYLGNAITSYDGDNPTVEGVDDSGGRVYFQIPQGLEVGLGRHRVHLVVNGDLSTTDLFLEVVPKGTPVFVSDVDGTLTSSENAEFGALLTGELPDVHPDSAEALRRLAAKGYQVEFLTARPEWLVGRTRELLDTNGFPAGVVHTTLGLTGATGSSAADFKTGELAMLGAKGMVPAWGFGNTASDADAYASAGITPLDQRVFYQFDDTVYGGRRIEDYSELLAEIDALPKLCP